MRVNWFPRFAGAFLGSFIGMCGALVIGLKYDEWEAARRKARKEAMLRHPAYQGEYAQTPSKYRRPA